MSVVDFDSFSLVNGGDQKLMLMLSPVNLITSFVEKKFSNFMSWHTKPQVRKNRTIKIAACPLNSKTSN